MPWVKFQTSERRGHHEATVANPDDKPVKDVRQLPGRLSVKPMRVAYGTRTGTVILTFDLPLEGEVAL